MSGHDFIFSDRQAIRLLRHSLFWLLWWGFFFGTFYTFQLLRSQTDTSITWNLLLASKSILVVLVHILACYFVIDYFLPRYALKGKWTGFLIGLFSICVLSFLVSLAIYAQLFPLMDTYLGATPVATKETLVWSSLNSGLLGGAKVIAIAVSIKLLKRWWLKQEEKEQLEKEKITAELMLLRAQIQPHFLFNSLNNIYALAMEGSPRTPEILLRLSDLLSYMLYDSSKSLVPLSKEMKMVEDYIALEKVRYGERLDLELRVKGQLEGWEIAPCILLPFIDNSFRQCSEMIEERPWINIELTVDSHAMSMKLINGVADPVKGDHLDNIRQRLNALYPGRHILKVSTVQEMFIVILKIPLELPETIGEELSAQTILV